MTNQETWQEKMMRENAELERQEALGEEGNTEESNLVKQENNNQNIDGTKVTSLDNLVSLANTEPPATTPTEQPDAVKNYEAKIAELEAALQRERSENGRAKQLSNTIRELQDENQRLAERLHEQGRVQPLDGDVDVFTEEEKEVISDDAQRIIGARFAKMRRDYEELQRKQEELIARFGRVDALAVQNDREEMQRSIQHAFPNFETMVNGEAWRIFCGESDPVSKTPNGKLFLDAYERGDASAVIAMIQRFTVATGAGSGHIAVGARAPESSTVQTTAQTGVQTFNISDIDAFMSKALSGQIDLTNPKNAALLKTYEAALDEGRVR